MTLNEFITKANQYYKIEERMIEKIERYKNFLQQENKIHNLTRLDKEDIIYQEYFFDSIIPYIGFDFNDKKLLDIGSGSGTPGLILKIFFPKMNLTIIESNNKKIEFMKKLATILEFDDIVFLNQRAEEIKIDQREKFDFVTSRAVASLKILVEISTPYLKTNGLLIEPKSINYKEELNEANDIISKMQLKLLDIREYDENTKKHFVFVFKKTGQTDLKYPRLWKEIIK